MAKDTIAKLRAEIERLRAENERLEADWPSIGHCPRYSDCEAYKHDLIQVRAELERLRAENERLTATEGRCDPVPQKGCVMNSQSKTKTEYLAMFRTAEKDLALRQKVIRMVEDGKGPYLDPGHPFRMALAEWLREQSNRRAL